MRARAWLREEREQEEKEEEEEEEEEREEEEKEKEKEEEEERVSRQRTTRRRSVLLGVVVFPPRFTAGKSRLEERYTEVKDVHRGI